MALPIRLHRAIRYLSDPRNAWNVAWAFSPDTLAHMATGGRVDLAPYRPRTGIAGRTVTLCLTFDVERDWGSFTPTRSLRSLEPFVLGVTPLLRKLGAPATFFVEGGIVRERPETWAQLAREGHEIGLHGFHHESWGVDWFNDLDNSPLVSSKQGQTLLKLAVAAFERGGLPPPRAFRAPNLVLDPRFWPVLFESGFRVDSSGPGMKGERPLARPLYTSATGETLLSLPASAPIVPQVVRAGGLPQFRYALLSLQNVLRMDPTALVAYAEDICRYQIARGQSPHLTFLAHPWEFVEPPARVPDGAGQIGARNFDAVAALAETLAAVFQLKHRTLSGLAAIAGRHSRIESVAGHAARPGTNATPLTSATVIGD